MPTQYSDDLPARNLPDIHGKVFRVASRHGKDCAIRVKAMLRTDSPISKLSKFWSREIVSALIGMSVGVAVGGTGVGGSGVVCWGNG